MRRASAVAVLCTAAAVLAGCAGPSAIRPDDGASDAPTATATATRQDLIARDELNGSLRYRDRTPLVAGRGGVVTWTPRVGSVIRRGGVVAEIDGGPTRLLRGDRPAWRRLAIGCPAGPDIRQLNDNLAALGYAERDDLPRRRFDWRTQLAVVRWQDDLGLPRTGAVELGDVLFLPAAVRIGSVEARRGTWVGPGQVLAIATGRHRAVTVDVDASQTAGLAKGTAVTVVLPDRTRLGATVRSLDRVVTPPAGADQVATVGAEIALADDPPRRLVAAPVTVVVERVIADDVVTVPVGALLAVAGGGYVVERLTPGGIERVPVDPGSFSLGLVEVRGGVADGDEVVVPS